MRVEGVRGRRRVGTAAVSALSRPVRLPVRLGVRSVRVPVRLGVLLVALLLVLAGCRSGEGAAVEPTPAPVSPAPTEAPEPPDPEPTVDPAEAEREALLAELRAGDGFLELAEHERAMTAPWARFGWYAFASFDGDELLFEWANKAELWDSLAPVFRDECLLAGPEATRPMWEAQLAIPALTEPRWTNKSTEGRGQFVDFSCIYSHPHDQQPVWRWWGTLIATDEDVVGRVAAVSEPFDVTESDYPDFATAVEDIKDRLWEWIFQQPVVQPVDDATS